MASRRLARWAQLLVGQSTLTRAERVSAVGKIAGHLRITMLADAVSGKFASEGLPVPPVACSTCGASAGAACGDVRGVDPICPTRYVAIAEAALDHEQPESFEAARMVLDAAWSYLPKNVGIEVVDGSDYPRDVQSRKQPS